MDVNCTLLLVLVLVVLHSEHLLRWATLGFCIFQQVQLPATIDLYHTPQTAAIHLL